MHIGIDVHVAAKPNRRGVPHYVEQVVPRLMTLGAHEDWLLLYVGTRDWEYLPRLMREHPATVRIARGRVRTLLNLRATGRGHDALLGQIDVMFLPALAPTRVTAKVPVVLTVHDLLHITHHEHFGIRNRVWFKLIDPSGQISRAELLLANSSHTKAELLRYTDLSESDVRVVRHGVDDWYFGPCPDAELASVLARHQLRPGYIFHLGTIEPRKNVDSLVAASALLRRRRPGTELVLAGAPGRQLQERYPTWVRVLGMVPDGDKRALYAAAGAYCSVAHAEGLGLTPLEALACGTPSVVSSIPAFLESLGPEGAVFVVDHVDPRAVADGLELVLDDEKTRGEILASAPRVLARHRWDACAQKTYEAIREARQRRGTSK